MTLAEAFRIDGPTPYVLLSGERGAVVPKSNVCSLVSSQLRAGHEGCVGPVGRDAAICSGAEAGSGVDLSRDKTDHLCQHDCRCGTIEHPVASRFNHRAVYP